MSLFSLVQRLLVPETLQHAYHGGGSARTLPRCVRTNQMVFSWVEARCSLSWIQRSCPAPMVTAILATSQRILFLDRGQSHFAFHRRFFYASCFRVDAACSEPFVSPTVMQNFFRKWQPRRGHVCSQKTQVVRTLQDGDDYQLVDIGEDSLFLPG